MRAIAISNVGTERTRDLIDQMHRLRARVFGGRLGWDVQIEEGRETDEYDRLDPTYILAATATDMIVGCARLLPTTGPTMLERTFPQLLDGGQLVAHRGMIESSRFCVDTTATTALSSRTLHQATLALFAAIIEWSMANSYREIVTATDVRFERILQRAHWPMRRLGEVHLIGETISVAGTLPADRISFEKVCPPGYASEVGVRSAVAA